jgi:pimeloyl-ACP methyl ester carboxylesterase
MPSWPWSRWSAVQRRRAGWLLTGAYVALLTLSNALQPSPRAPQPDGPGRIAVRIPSHTDAGAVAGSSVAVSLIHWPAAEGAAGGLPLVCLHGSPGSATNFQRLAPRLAAAGRDVWAIDLPGFGESRGAAGGTSILAHARALLAALDALGIERAHLLGWSLGGGVALHAADLAPERSASLALVASIGVQETEGSGSYVFEHAKYAAWLVAMEMLDHLVPHFGLLTEVVREGRASAINFLETDQRPLRGILERLQAPALIVHGRGDALAPFAAARASHALVRSSRLVVLEANHFLPFLQVDELTAELEPFLARHDGAGVPEPRASVEARPRTRWGVLEPDVMSLGLALPWWLQFAALALAVACAPRWSALASGAAVAALQLDFGLVALALAAGACGGALWKRDRALGWLAAPLRAWGWMLLALTLSAALGGLLALAGVTAPRLITPCAALALIALGTAWRRGRSRTTALAAAATR